MHALVYPVHHQGELADEAEMHDEQRMPCEYAFLQESFRADFLAGTLR
jgi:hypothetical protein